MRTRIVLAAVAALALTGTHAQAFSDPGKCEAAKNKVAGKYYFCREKAEAKALTTGGTPDYSKCTSTFDEKWNLAETNGGGVCPDSVFTVPMNAYIAGQAADAAAIIAGTQGIPACGDNTINVAGEQCDGTDVGGETCLTLGFASGSLTCASCLFDTSGCACGGGGGGGGFPATGQTTCWDTAGVVISCAGTGYDGDIQAGAPLAYTDNGDGTVTDDNTGLMWEKLSADGGIHDVYTAYTWGDAFAVKVATLNSGSFAGYADWRLPNRRELDSIVNLQNLNPAVSPAFHTSCTGGCAVTSCSCIATTFPYWTSSTYAFGSGSAWAVEFYGGDVNAVSKAGNCRVRAVRGGL